MKKTFFVVILFFMFSVNPAYASLVSINNDGDMTWNVLAAESDKIALENPNRESLEVTNVVENPDAESNADVFLARVDGAVKLTVETDSGTKQADITGYTSEIVEIEERNEPQKIAILTQGDKFIVRQKGISASTEYPIQIKSSDRELSVETPSGIRYLGVLPYDALSYVIRANILNNLTEENSIELFEGDEGELTYQISGNRKIDLFKLVEFDVPVIARVSATTGQVLSVDQPTWFRVTGFLFS